MKTTADAAVEVSRERLAEYLEAPLLTLDARLAHSTGHKAQIELLA